MSFKPNFQITSVILNFLLRIETVKETIQRLPITPALLASLRATARFRSTHYSTMIEGNRLSKNEVIDVLVNKKRFADRKRDTGEVLGFYAALDYAENLASERKNIEENDVEKIHALVMGNGRENVKPTPYRTGQNAIRDGRTGGIVYMPPKAEDVPKLMKELFTWLEESELPIPIKAAIAHYQFATVHPYYDGNGRTARLLTTMFLQGNGYDLKGIYCLEEYYAQNLDSYYRALSLGPSHNYYFGRAETDVTPWLEYFCGGMADSFESAKRGATVEEKKGAKDSSQILRKLDPRQRKALGLFENKESVTSADIAELFGVRQRAARVICGKWVEEDFFSVNNPSNRRRSYILSDRWKAALEI